MNSRKMIKIIMSWCMLAVLLVNNFGSSILGVCATEIETEDEVDDNGGVLTGDLDITGDYYLRTGVLDLAGHMLTIDGTLILAGGTINVNGGRLIVNGDLRRQNIYTDEDDEEVITTSNGNIVMHDPLDYVLIKGNYVDSGIKQTTYDLTDGTMEIKGSILADDSLDHRLLSTSKNHVLKLTGEGRQTIESGVSYSGGFTFSNLIVEQAETGSVEMLSDITVTSKVYHLSGNISGRTYLSESTQTSPVLYGSIILPQTYVFTEDVTINGDLYMTIHAKYKTGEYKFNNVTIKVNGSCYIGDSTVEVAGDEGRLDVRDDINLTEYNCVFKSGDIYVMGNIVSKNTNAKITSMDAAKMYFAGEDRQRIAVDNKYSVFCNIVVDNPQGILVNDGISIVNVECISGSIGYLSGGIHGFKLDNDLEYDGDLIIAGGVLDLNGKSLHVKGNLVLSGGAINMTDEKDYLLVDSDFIVNAWSVAKGNIDNGVLEVKGDFSIDNGGESYVPKNNHTTIFSGEKEQNITINNTSYSVFNNVKFLNQTGVMLKKNVIVNGQIEQDGNVTGTLKIRKDARFVNEHYSGDICVDDSITLSDDLSIDGNLYINSSVSVHLDGNDLSVTGEIRFDGNNSSLCVEHGLVRCGSMWVKKFYGPNMKYEDDKIIVNGDFRADGRCNNVKNGTMQIGGDIIFSNTAYVDFPDELILDLTGTHMQTIEMHKDTGSLGHVVINNQSPEGIYVTDVLNYTNIDNNTGCVITLQDGSVMGYTMQKDEVIESDMILSGGVMNLNGYTLTVKGDCIYNGGTITLNNGTLIVEKDFYNNAKIAFGEGIVDINGNWNANADVSANGTGIYIAGNIQSTKTFDLSNADEVCMDGTKKQECRLSNSNTMINNYILNNEYGVVCSNNGQVRLCGSITTNGYPVEGWMYICGDLTDEYVNSNVYFEKNTKLGHDIRVIGDVDLGYLDMNGKKLTVDGDCYIGLRGGHIYRQNEGTLELRGSLYAKHDGQYEYCFGDGTRVILSGDRKQIIDSYYETYWNFHNLVITNTSDEGVYAEELFDADIITDPEHKLTFPIPGDCGYTLTEDTVIEGDCDLLVGKMDLNGYRLTVTGDLTQYGGQIFINGGELYVNGNYMMVGHTWQQNYIENRSLLIMENESDYVFVAGDCMIDTIYNITQYMKKGTLELKGDYTYTNRGSGRIELSKDLIMIFSGNEMQQIQCKYIYGNRYYSPGTIVINNFSDDGVVLTSDIYIKNQVDNIKYLHGVDGVTLYWDNDKAPDITSFEGNLTLLQECTLTQDINVKGTVTLEASLDINGHMITADNMNINGSCILSKGVINLKNDLIMNTYKSCIVMNDINEIIRVDGAFEYNKGSLKLYAGTLDIRGDISLNRSNIAAGEKHTTVLGCKLTDDGTAYTQKIYAANGVMLNRLELTKPAKYYSYNGKLTDICRELIENIQDIAPPSVPKGLAVSDVNCSSLRLTWEESEDESGVFGYDVYRDGKKIITVTGTDYTDKKLTPGTEYVYTVSATDAMLNASLQSKEIRVTTADDETAPSVPSGLYVKERLGSELAISWDKSLDDSAVAGYHVFRDGVMIAEVNNENYEDNGLKANTKYCYQISSYDAFGNESELSKELTAYTKAVEADEVIPGEYNILYGNPANIKVAFHNTGSSKGYQVIMSYREKDNDKSYIFYKKTVGKNTVCNQIIETAASLDTADIESEEIVVTIKIKDAGEYAFSQDYTYYLDKTAPSKLNEAGVDVREGIAVISFEKGKEADIAGYRIYRKEADDEPRLYIESDNIDKTYYYDRTIKEGVEYTYYVAAYDTGGLEGEWSEAIVITANADTVSPRIERVEPFNGTVSGKTKIQVSASDNKALDRIKAEMISEEGQNTVLLVDGDIENGSVQFEWDTTNFDGKTAAIRYTVFDKSGNSNDEEFICTYTIDNVGPSAPTGLNAYVYSTTAVLSWDEPIDDDYAYAVIEQADGDNYKEIARETSVTGCILEGLVPEETKEYRVVFYDRQGNRGRESSVISVTAGADTVEPRILSVSPNNGYYNGNISLCVRAEDNCGVKKITTEYSTDNILWEILQVREYTTAEKKAVMLYDFDTSDIPEGDFIIRTYAEDEAGNISSKEQMVNHYIIDHTAPVSIDKLAADSEAGSIHLKWNEPVDNDVAGYRLYRSIAGLNSYSCIADSIQMLGYYDRDIAYDTVYSYQVTAYDHAGNESERSNIAYGQKKPDDVKPMVHSISPATGSSVSGRLRLEAYVSDNERVTETEFSIRGLGEDDVKQVIDNVSIDGQSCVAECIVDSRVYPNGEYEVSVIAKDAAGNISDVTKTDIRIHNVNLEMPELYAISGDWCVNLHCTVEPSLDYVLYRKNQQTEDTYIAIATGTGSLIYRDVNVDPRYTYIYQLEVQDTAGNSALSILQYVKPKAVDSIPPTAVINTNTSVIEGYETIFSATESTDNDRIKSYIWDFGDESGEGTGPSPKHTYSKEGEYVVKLTVTDRSGNTDYMTTRITVLPKSGAGKAYVTVRNSSGSPLKGVTVYVNSTAEKNNISTTDSKGCTTIMEKPGTYKIAMYKPGYMAVEKSIEIELHGDKEYVFILAEGDTISADFEVHQMNFDEIVAAGIDLSNPENRHVYTVSTKLSFADATRTGETIDNIPMKPVKALVVKNGKNDDGNSGGGGASSGNGGGGSIEPHQEETGDDEPEPDIYYTICINQSISWLKDMYEATLIVYNNAASQTIVAKDLSATLSLPAGLSLAATRNGQGQQLSLPDLKGGETGSVSWYVRGDAPGTYKLNAMLNGTLQPFDEAFTCGFTSDEFEVTAGKGLVLTICPEDRAEKGEMYYVYYTLSNEGSKEFYNVHTTFGTKHNNSKRYISSSDGTKRVPVMSEGDIMAVDCLKPGESISGIYRTAIPVEGDKWYNYRKLVDAQCKACAGSNLGVEVRLSVVSSHVPVPALVHQPATDENSEADPVNVSTGAYTDSITALSVQGVNPVSANLSYDSNATADLGEFGYGWTHNYETRLLDMNDGTVRYYASPTGYYTFLAEDYESKKEIKTDKDGYLYVDVSNIPMKQDFKCLNDNKAGYELRRSEKGDYTLTDKAGNISRFDKKGNLKELSNREGKTLIIERDSEEFTVTDKTSKRSLTYELDKDTKLITSVTDGDRTAYFYYDSNKCLKQYDNALGESTYYTYDDRHRITTVTNDDGVTYVENAYVLSEDAKTSSEAGDAYKAGRVKSQKDALGNVTKFSYKEDGTNGNLTTTVTTRSGAKKETVTDPYGNVVSFTNEAGDTTITTYDDNGNETYVNQPEMTTIDGRKTSYSISYTYDGDGNMLSMSNSMLEKGEKEVVMSYDDDGNMLTMTNRNGESMECTYYDNGQIKTVRDQNGNVITYTYNKQGQILNETDGNKRSVTYKYRDGDLVSVTDKNGNETTYTYNEEGLVEDTTIKDKVTGEEYTTTTFYDALGRTSMVLDADGGTTFYEYDCNGNITEKTEPAGAKTVYAYDGNGQMTRESVYPDSNAEEPESVTEYAYTKEGLLKRVTDDKSGTVITNSYDKTGNKTKEIEKKGDKRLSETHYAYDELGNMIKETALIIDETGNETGRLSTEYIYYPNSKLNKVTDYRGAATTYSYDKSWRVQTVESTTEPKITYDYDPAGRVIKETRGETNGNIFNKSEAVSTSYEYDIYGHVTKATDAKGNSTQYVYDANGNLIETIDAKGGITYSKYDSLNRVIETGVRKPGTTEEVIYQNLLAAKTRDDNGEYSDRDKKDARDSANTFILARTSYSINNHTVTTTDMINGGSVTTYYDAAGREVKTVNGDNVVLSETVYDTENRILQTVDAKGMVSENVYNSLGQIEKVNEGAKGDKKEDGTYSFIGDIHTESYEYDDLGRTTKVTDAEGGISSVVFDSLGRIVSLKDPNQNAKDAEGETWSLNNGNTYTYEYNDKGLLYKETNSLNNVTTYEYNAQMLLDTMTDSADEETKYEYDSLNRPWKVKDSLGTIEYEYDANGNVLEVSEKEGLLSPTKSIVRTYDELNRVTSYTDYKGREVKYGYDELGNMIELTYPGGEIVRYTYNPDGTVATMSSNSGGTFTYGYDNYGRLSRISRPDGSVEERTYTTAGLLETQTDTDRDGNILQNNTYKYDVFGEIREKTTSTDGDLTRLVSVSMEYDSANRLTKYNGEDVIYDVKGNMTYGPVDGEMTELTYDCRNRLTKAGKVSYTYDCENTRTATTEDGITTEYVTDTGGSLSRMLIAYEDIGTANTSETHYYYGAEGLSCQNNETTGQYFAYHYDNIGSTTLVTDKTGRKIEEFAYGTYGELLTEVVNNIRFLYNGSYGVVTDSNGLYYMRARYYNPDIKRFINQDIKVGDISNGQGLNRYVYCEGNPVSMVDPFGLCGEDAGDQGEPNKYQWLHTALDVAGLVFDGADVINAGVYALEGKWGQAAVSLACALPAIGTAIAGVTKATKLAKAGNIIGQTMKYAGKAYMTVQTATQALELAGDARMQYAINGGKLTWDIAKKAVGAAALGALSVMSAGSLMKDVTSLTKMPEMEFHTTVRETSDEFCGRYDENGFPQCFVAGTKVKTDEGDKNIEDIEEGDYVLSEDPETGEQGYKKVVQVFVNETEILVHVYIKDEEIITTASHPFYVENVGYVVAGELYPDDIVRLSDGRKVPVKYIEFEYLDDPVKIYNFEIEDFHTYYVSDIGVLVHNMCPPKTIKTEGANFYVGPKGAATSLEEYDKFVEGGSGRKTLYHYTNEKGLTGITESNQLNPSLKANNPKDARYGNGQYLSDINPESTTPTKLAKKFINVPNKYKYTHYIEIDVSDLNVIQGRDGVYVIPNEEALDLTGRIINSGKVGD